MDSIGPYRIKRVVAEGGLSTVYAAVDPRDGRRVAIKVARFAADSPDHAWVVDRFRQECSLLSKLSHPSIVSIFDEGFLPDGSPFVISEWVDGRSLQDILQAEKRIPWATALTIAEQVAGALGAAHALGFVHSDVKPSNILIQKLEPSAPVGVKLLDFGVAGRLDLNTRQTHAGVLMGTPSYMSPEQIRAGPLAPQSDVWGLGVVLFQMLTGSLPFGGTEMMALMTAILNAQFTIPPDANLPPLVAAFLMRCLNKDAKLRPANGGEAAKEIGKLRAELAPLAVLPPAASPALHVPFPALSPSPAAAIPATYPTIPALHPQPAPASAGTLRLLVAATTFTALAGTLVFLFRHSHPALRPWTGVALGVALAVVGTLLGRALQQVLAARQRAITAEVQGTLSSAHSRRRMSATLAIQVDELIAKCRLVDERFLGTTMAVMVEEYSAAKNFDDGQKALMNAVALLEKLTPKLSPWYVRNDKLIGFLVTLVGILSGMTAVVQNLAKLIKGN